MHKGSRLSCVIALLMLNGATLHVEAQCDAIALTPAAAVTCASKHVPLVAPPELDQQHVYSLAELVDIAERNNPATRSAWERARQRAENLGVAKSDYLPLLVGVATFADQRFVNPFPNQFAPRGYSMVETPLVQPEIKLQYLLFDFGMREGKVASARAQSLAAGAAFIFANQQIALSVSKAYYSLQTAEERTHAAREILKTSKTTQDAAEARLQNGRATLPDLLNAKSATAQAAFDLATADGQEQISRVSLVEALGLPPSPDIHIEASDKTTPPNALSATVDELVKRAISDRPDLQEQTQQIQAAKQQIRVAKGAYRPSITLSGSAAQTAIWPTADSATFGPANEPTWSAALTVQWRIFDGGARKNNLAIAESRERDAEAKYDDLRDQAQRAVWTSYVAFQTAMRQQDAAKALLTASEESYSASLDAYNSGVQNLIDVVTAEKQLATARLSAVSARSLLFTEAVELEFTTGNLLRFAPRATTTHPRTGEHP